MEDLNKLLHLTEIFPRELEQMTEEFLVKLRGILWGQEAISENKEEVKYLPIASPHQPMKRAKRLSLLTEVNEIEDKLENPIGSTRDKRSPTKKKRSNAELLAAAQSLENEGVATETEAPVPSPRTQFDNPTVSNTVENSSTLVENLRSSEGINLMPPPSNPIACVAETLNKRPQRAAKQKSEKNLKEPQLKGKMRRPTNEVKIKLEHQQRASQIHDQNSDSSKHSALSELNENTTVTSNFSSKKSNDSVCIIPGKEPSIVSISSDVDVRQSTVADNNKQPTKAQNKSGDSIESGMREVCIKIKREKVSLENQENLQQKPSTDAVFKLPAPISLTKTEALIIKDTSLGSSILSVTSNITTSAPAKKTRKKKEVIHKPIKVERLSDLDPKPAPISSRTRNGSLNKPDNVENMLTKETKRQPSIYEDAVETPSIPNEPVTLVPTADATMNLGTVTTDTTFCSNQAQTTFVMESNLNATITLNNHSGSGNLADATFEVQKISKLDKNKEDDIAGQRSFETAKDSSIINNSILTEDEQEKPTETKPKASKTNNKAKETAKTYGSAKAVYKLPARTNELFNPLAQSPVKMRVEAFENAAAAATDQSTRPLRNKKIIITSSSSTTPTIGKLPAPALGRFLTPTQSSNLSSVNSAVVKKVTSASKVLPMLKSGCASSLQRSNSSASVKTLLQRENSADDFRKGLHSLAEERKKQREQKHLLAAQQREAKERERAERIAKLAKEREDKRNLKKQQEQDQKKRELEEIQRKLRQQKEDDEHAAKLKATKERELLIKQQQQQLAKNKMLPPAPKLAAKYTFEMLHEDDSTDDEDKVSYKRPPPPTWSRSNNRGSAMLKQEYTPSAYIDSFFSVQPMTPDLKIIFPNIDARHLKRNSSVLWSTPPRYSELPKY